MRAESIFHPWLDDVEQYVPGRPPGNLAQAARMDVTRLASNENPLGPSPKAVEAFQQTVPDLNRYPDDTTWVLREALAREHDVGTESIAVGNGSNDLIDQCIRITVGPGLEVVMAEGSFPTPRISAKAIGGDVRLVPLKDYRHDLEAMAEAVSDRTRVVYVCNPNNPTGTMNTREEVERLLGRLPEHLLLVVDEAYYEYVRRQDYPDLRPMVREGRPIVLLRTFSKVHSLASLRIGYGICPPAVVERLHKVRLPFNVNGVAQTVALAALRDREHVERSVSFALEGKAELARRLRSLGIRVVDSVTNFLMVQIPVPRQTLQPQLLEQGIQIRPLGSFQLPDDHYRITVGTREEDERLVDALSRILRQ